MASILMASRFMEKTPFTFIVEYEAAGVNIAKQKKICAALSFPLALRYNKIR